MSWHSITGCFRPSPIVYHFEVVNVSGIGETFIIENFIIK